MERLGATISSCLTNAGPLFAIVIAISFLGEQPTASNILGAISIVGGIIALSWKGVAKTWRTRDLGFPLTAALLFAARDNLVRFAVVQIPSPVVGAAIAATTSLFTMGTLYAIFGEKKPLPASAKLGLRYFGISGFYELSFLCLDLYRAQSGASFDYLTAGECLLSLRPAAVDAAPQRRGNAHAAENRRDGTSDSRRSSDLLGKIMKSTPNFGLTALGNFI